MVLLTDYVLLFNVVFVEESVTFVVFVVALPVTLVDVPFYPFVLLVEFKVELPVSVV